MFLTNIQDFLERISPHPAPVLFKWERTLCLFSTFLIFIISTGFVIYGFSKIPEPPILQYELVYVPDNAKIEHEFTNDSLRVNDASTLTTNVSGEFSFVWTLGDADDYNIKSGTEESREIALTYATEGKKHITLTIFNDNDTSFIKKIIEVYAMLEPVASLSDTSSNNTTNSSSLELSQDTQLTASISTTQEIQNEETSINCTLKRENIEFIYMDKPKCKEDIEFRIVNIGSQCKGNIAWSFDGTYNKQKTGEIVRHTFETGGNKTVRVFFNGAWQQQPFIIDISCTITVSDPPVPKPYEPEPEVKIEIGPNEKISDFYTQIFKDKKDSDKEIRRKLKDDKTFKNIILIDKRRRKQIIELVIKSIESGESWKNVIDEEMRGKEKINKRKSIKESIEKIVNSSKKKLLRDYDMDMRRFTKEIYNDVDNVLVCENTYKEDGNLTCSRPERFKQHFESLINNVIHSKRTNNISYVKIKTINGGLDYIYLYTN